MKYSEWIVNEVPEGIRKDPLWDLELYRKALFLSDIAWNDCEKLLKHPLGKQIAYQLIRSAGSVAANIEEGYGRGYGKDYARFLKIALGSARETRGWYFRSRSLIEQEVYKHRIKEYDAVIAGLVVISKQQSRYRKPSA